jgi:hypothetical protein
MRWFDHSKSVAEHKSILKTRLKPKHIHRAGHSCDCEATETIIHYAGFRITKFLVSAGSKQSFLLSNALPYCAYQTKLEGARNGLQNGALSEWTGAAPDRMPAFPFDGNLVARYDRAPIVSRVLERQFVSAGIHAAVYDHLAGEAITQW